MTENLYIEGFGVEAHLPHLVNYQRLNKVTLSSAILEAIEHYQPWSGGLERLILRPKYILLPD